MPKRVHELEDLRLIEEEFCYLDRFIICTIQKHISEKSRDSFQKRLTINSVKYEDKTLSKLKSC